MLFTLTLLLSFFFACLRAFSTGFINFLPIFTGRRYVVYFDQSLITIKLVASNQVEFEFRKSKINKFVFFFFVVVNSELLKFRSSERQPCTNRIECYSHTHLCVAPFQWMISKQAFFFPVNLCVFILSQRVFINMLFRSCGIRSNLVHLNQQFTVRLRSPNVNLPPFH